MNKVINKNINVYLMYIIVFFQGFVFYGPIATLYRQSKGLSMSDIFLIESISWILMLIFEIPWGWFADRFGYKKTLIISNFLFFISKIVFYKASSFWMFFSERVLLSMVISGISGCDIALIYSSIDEKDSEKVFGRYEAFQTAGFLIASLMSSIILKHSMNLAAFLTIIPYGIAAVLTLFIVDVNFYSEQKPKIRYSLKTAFNNKSIIIFVLSAALIREVVQAISVFLNQPQYIRSGIKIEYFGIFLVAIQIIRLISAKAYKISNRFGKAKTIQLLYIIIGISCFILIFTSNAVLSVLLVIFVCASMSLIQPLAVDIQNKSITTQDRATILSIYAMVGDIVAALTNLYIGKAADVSVQTAFKSCVIICIIAYVLFLIYKKIVEFKFKK